MQDDANNIPYGTGTDDLLLRLSRHVGKDIRPLFHFWGIHPQNPSALAAAIAAENLPPVPAIRNQLLHYKIHRPRQQRRLPHLRPGWWGKKPSITGNWEERDHACSGTPPRSTAPATSNARDATNPGEIYNRRLRQRHPQPRR